MIMLDKFRPNFNYYHKFVIYKAGEVVQTIDCSFEGKKKVNELNQLAVNDNKTPDYVIRFNVECEHFRELKNHAINLGLTQQFIDLFLDKPEVLLK